jgi:DNA helicase-2/ATP-dependent DNA helicase PcrA
LAYRIARLIAEGASADSIVAFTFTEKSADSIKRRVADALSTAGLSDTMLGAMYIGTIHAYCQSLLGEMDARYRQFDVLDENRLKLYLISRYARLEMKTVKRGGYFNTIREVSDAWKTLNDEMVAIPEVARYNPRLGQVLTNIRTGLNSDQFIDFSLMIRLVVEALQRNDPAALRAVGKLEHLMVDEYQDVNPAQEKLIRELHARSSTLFVVGDDDQAIYAWRGADVQNILEFEQRYPSCATFTLAENFRSTDAIVQSADALVAAQLGPTRISKSPTSKNNRAPRDFRKLWFTTRADEADWVATRIQQLIGTQYEEQDGTVRGLTPGDFALLMRSTRTAEGDGLPPRHTAFTQALAARDVPFSLESGGGIFDRPHVSALRDTFELLRDGSPNRNVVRQHFDTVVLPSFPNADFGQLTRVLAEWGRLIHDPTANGQRRRVYPQKLVHELLETFHLAETPLDMSTMRDLGVFSRIIQDIEVVYLSIDTQKRYQDILNFLSNVAETGYDTSTDDMQLTPDAVMVSTVHKVKGLEFPVVFIVDVETRRFPADQKSYAGWLPIEVLSDALNRGAYQRTRDEEARLFYTALTRAERYLYVTGSRDLPGAKTAKNVSVFVQGLSHSELSADPAGLPDGLSPSPPKPRIDETILPTSYSDIRYYLMCPRNYQFRRGFGFSPPVPDLFGFGQTVHTAINKLHQTFPDSRPTVAEAEQIALNTFHLKHVYPANDPINRPGPYERARDRSTEIAREYVTTYIRDFDRERQVEARFEISIGKDAVISGAIDLILREDDQGNIIDARIVDFKSIEGGDDPASNEQLNWTELALQVQLYAKAARDVLGENAKTGHVHLLKDNQRIDVPITETAVQAALSNVSWAVERILAGDFPMRPHAKKCNACDFQRLCPQRIEEFQTSTVPPPLHIPGAMRSETRMARVFSEVEGVDDQTAGKPVIQQPDLDL